MIAGARACSGDRAIQEGLLPARGHAADLQVSSARLRKSHRKLLQPNDEIWYVDSLFLMDASIQYSVAAWSKYLVSHSGVIQMFTYQTYIDGKWVDAASGKTFQTF